MTHGVAENAVRNLALRRVLVIPLSVTGDVAFASPLIEVIKRARPDAASIDWRSSLWRLYLGATPG